MNGLRDVYGQVRVNWIVVVCTVETEIENCDIRVAVHCFNLFGDERLI